jgi:uncharacterized damage-inducible protein DinB
MPKPSGPEYGNFYQRYIDLVTGDNVLTILENSVAPLQDFLISLENKDLSYAYAPGKWTIAQLLQHIIDTERIFSYRALCIARGEKQSLPGFNENSYADAAPATNRKLKGIAEELLTIRKASIILFRSLEKEKALNLLGTASNNPISVNAIGFIMVGHVLHHQQVILEKYS